jgi:hypothetical protein
LVRIDTNLSAVVANATYIGAETVIASKVGRPSASLDEITVNCGLNRRVLREGPALKCEKGAHGVESGVIRT